MLLLPPLALVLWAHGGERDDGQRVLLRIDGSEPSDAIAERLRAAGAIESPHLFAWYLRLRTLHGGVGAGTHLLRTGLSANALVDRLVSASGRGAARVVIPEGSTYLQIGERLEAHEVCLARAFAEAAVDARLLAELHVPAASAEGFLFPASYDFLVDSDAATLVRTLVLESRKRLDHADQKSGGALARLQAARGWGELEVLTLASMIEKEAAVAEERPLIASVFLNRLDDAGFRPQHMLQSDPTAAYGCVVAPALAPSCAGFHGHITPEVLRDAANPYNTYRRPGLPPGPIANPGESSVLAVLAPAQTDYFYFVAVGHGRHHFSHSFEEHRRAIDDPK